MFKPSETRGGMGQRTQVHASPCGETAAVVEAQEGLLGVMDQEDPAIRTSTHPRRGDTVRAKDHAVTGVCFRANSGGSSSDHRHRCAPHLDGSVCAHGEACEYFHPNLPEPPSAKPHANGYHASLAEIAEGVSEGQGRFHVIRHQASAVSMRPARIRERSRLRNLFDPDSSWEDNRLEPILVGPILGGQATRVLRQTRLGPK